MEKITLNQIKNHRPCKDGWIKLLKSLGKTSADDEPISLQVVLESSGLSDALWCLRVLPWHLETQRKIAELTLLFVKPVVSMMSDKRSVNAVKVLKNFALGKTSVKELRKSCIEAAKVANTAMKIYAAAYANVSYHTSYATAAYAADAAFYATDAATATTAKAAAEAVDATIYAVSEFYAATADKIMYAINEAKKRQEKSFSAWIEKNNL